MRSFFRRLARLVRKAKAPAQTQMPVKVDINRLSFRPFPGNAGRNFQSRSVRGNAA
jgi:hypothetical protein